MSRLRQFNNKILEIGQENSFTRDTDDIDDMVPIVPIDSQEQEELIEKFTLNNHLRNNWYIKVFTICFLLCAGLFLQSATTKHTDHTFLFLICFQSIICTCITLRYELLHDYKIFGLKMIRVKNSTINAINCILLVLIGWISSSSFKEQSIIFLISQLPLLLFIIGALLKKWIKDMELEVAGLRNMKYKYKNV
ncbi:uncharacterized protein NDAI_0K02560 [Naumovozyma dairenensis CBS 421]|uniref:Uncharacterized protein n=1 Tax=Naumovozyma dairenensis (strain ATCC 10597 / BCRC 20456 / CBS 421 / NBRC 0211 / NRRL Y-12639) TaxID=1071378 RepID=G0WI36_NAUDC|nr:hypothetical protein NDAI_0K02560 [Naumovozyma dairenensis CBS 421]CCD27447.1 hypothetical protein NDAI_0K02560 [Naumovozyma dairenensis CBS 421]